MKKYQVTIEETLTYVVEVEAANESQAEEAAFNSEEFTSNLFKDNDARVKNVEILAEAVEEN